MTTQVSKYMEMDLSGRYGRYNKVLGRGSYKTVYKAFDEVAGIEVAWNQVKIMSGLQSPEDLEKVYSEVHILSSLKHNNVMEIYGAWVDPEKKHVIFITELFTSGSLKDYRKQHEFVDIQAIRKWVREILSGLDYLHTHNPPIVHRDIKCDNIFIHGSRGEVKIGDFGLAAIIPQSHTLNGMVGTSMFAAPEMYGNSYDERVDIYSFGMCVLELVTLEYPYNECTNNDEVRKAATSGQKPSSLNRVQDPRLKAFVKKCLRPAKSRPSAKELFLDPFLQSCEGDWDSHDLGVFTPPFKRPRNLRTTSNHRRPCLTHMKDKRPLERNNITAKAERIDEFTVLFWLKITDSYEGYVTHMRKVRFQPWLGKNDCMDVARELIAQLQLLDEDVQTIADIITVAADEQLQESHACNGQVSDGDHGIQSHEYGVFDGEVSDEDHRTLNLVPDWRWRSRSDETVWNGRTSIASNVGSQLYSRQKSASSSHSYSTKVMCTVEPSQHNVCR